MSTQENPSLRRNQKSVQFSVHYLIQKVKKQWSPEKKNKKKMFRSMKDIHIGMHRND